MTLNIEKSQRIFCITWFSCTLIIAVQMLLSYFITWFSCTLISHEFMNSWKHESCRHKCLVVKLISLSRFLKVWRHTWFPNLQCNLLMLQNGVIYNHYLNDHLICMHLDESWIHEFKNSWIHESILLFYLYNSMSL